MSEHDLQEHLLTLNLAGASHRAIANEYGRPVTYGDVGRILKGVFPKGKQKRVALGLPPSSTIILVGDGEVPDGSQAIRALRCGCGAWFIANHPRRTHCFICRPARQRRST